MKSRLAAYWKLVSNTVFMNCQTIFGGEILRSSCFEDVPYEVLSL